MLDTNAKITWCPGCGNFGILNAVKQAITEMDKEGIKKENFVIAAGIGCHAKIIDYINVNSYYSLHGRVPPPLTGMKLANPDLKVIGFSGDGDSYAEGIAHLIHSAKRNTDITMIIHDNEVFALTTGQFTPTSKKGFKGKSSPRGSVEEPINPLKIMLASGASFVARGYAGKPNHLKDLIKRAVKHRGFSLVEVMQPCVAFNNTYQELNEKVQEIKEKDLDNLKEAMKKVQDFDGKIPIGIFYQVKKQVFEDHF